MRHTLFASARLAGIGLCAAPLPSEALPVAPAGVHVPAYADITPVSMHRRHRMRQGSASRGNAGMPSRGAGGQQSGQTTGGPRR